MDAYQIIKHPISTEKAVRLMESENKLIFIVDRRSSKIEIKQALEEIFKIKAEKINTLINKGEKKAYVKLPKETPALDIATKMGLI
ncbi:MAG: 50S ribosomal protein L23 [Candidatus Nanoarchaeia archaeon]|nr:50S ribosomal protein L23 [Candidatus Nanoarchaeia archaeon]